MYKPTRKQIYAALVILAALLVIYFGILRESPVAVDVLRVEKGVLVETVDAEGRTRFHDRFVVTAPVSGKMFRVELHEGAKVPKGYLITRIDPAPPKPTDPASQPAPQIVPSAYPVYAPVSGILTSVFERSDRIVEVGTPIVEISSPSRLELVIDVLSTDATKVRPGMPVIAENWGGSGTLRAAVRTVEPQAFTKVSALGVEEQRVNIIADFRDPPEKLGGNFKVDARIVLWEGKNVLQVPANVLFRTGDKWTVFVVEDGRAALREVESGRRSSQTVEIIRGLKEGETVILHPPNTVSDGTRVEW